MFDTTADNASITLEHLLYFLCNFSLDTIFTHNDGLIEMIFFYYVFQFTTHEK